MDDELRRKSVRKALFQDKQPDVRKTPSVSRASQVTSPRVGDHFSVQRSSDDAWHHAKIVQMRRNKENGDREYYVHFIGFDRRLDEWLDIERIDLTTRVSTQRYGGGKKGKKRGQKRKREETTTLKEKTTVKPSTSTVERVSKPVHKVKIINTITMGRYEMDTWYHSPYPEEYGEVQKLWICEYCFKYMRLESSYRLHVAICRLRQPPGNEIYRKGVISVYEVSGKDQKLYCQNLCLLAKLFLDKKAMFYDVDPFWFYILTEVDRVGAHLVGYFSKEKVSPKGHNVACILTLPPHQRKGYGKFLIAFSYALSRLEGVVGTPEKPLSDLGRLSYRSYWSWVLLEQLHRMNGNYPSIRDLSRMTSIAHKDVVATLKYHDMVRFWNGQNIILTCPAHVYEHLTAIWHKRPVIEVDMTCLRWMPHPKPPRSVKGRIRSRHK